MVFVSDFSATKREFWQNNLGQNNENGRKGMVGKLILSSCLFVAMAPRAGFFSATKRHKAPPKGGGYTKKWEGFLAGAEAAEKGI